MLLLQAARYSSRSAEAAADPADQAVAHMRAAQLLLQAVESISPDVRSDPKEDPRGVLLCEAVSSARKALEVQQGSVPALCSLARCQMAAGMLNDSGASVSTAAAAIVARGGGDGGPGSQQEEGAGGSSGLAGAELVEAEVVWRLHVELAQRHRELGQVGNALMLAAAVTLHTELSSAVYLDAAKVIEELQK